MGFDVVVIDAISDGGFQAMGINNGDEHPDIFTGVEHSLSRSLDAARHSSNDRKVWLTETAFTEVSSIIDEVYVKCHGIVTDSGYYYCNEPRWHEYECYFDETSIVSRFIVQAEISIDAPGSAREGDNVAINVAVTNTGVITAELGAELYEGDTLIGACAGTSILGPGAWIMSQYTKTMPNHDWNLTAKVVSIPAVDTTKDFTIALTSSGSPCVAGDVHTTPCDDGTEIVTERCVGGGWVGTGNTCPGDEYIPGDEDMIECNQTIRALLKHYDSNNDGTISMEELMTAIDDRKAGTITQAELDFIEAAWQRGVNGIEMTCPATKKDNTTTYIAIGAGLLGLYLYLRG